MGGRNNIAPPHYLPNLVLKRREQRGTRLVEQLESRLRC